MTSALHTASTQAEVQSTRLWQGGWRQGVAYGGLGLPLAFVALPLYVVLPPYYAREFGVALATLGLLLLLTRLLDAVADPFIGRWADRLLGRSPTQAWRWAAAAAGLLALGFTLLFFPFQAARGGPNTVLAWCAACLVLTYLSFSVVTVVHQSWGARLGGDGGQRASIVGWREGLALLGVLLASILSAQSGMGITATVFALSLAIGMVLLWFSPRPPAAKTTTVDAVSMALPFRTPAFRRLLAVYLVNGTASAIPATLVLFFISDRLQTPQYEALFLASYFAAAGLSVPLWVRAVKAFGLSRSWLLGMGLSVAVFVWATALGAGDVAGFTAVCILSGLALGADLTLPSALLAGVIQRAGHGGLAEGAYFGWWNFATKLNLALAAGLALPLLQWWGYTPGNQTVPALVALTWAYCLLPCALKLLAAGLLWRYWIQPQTPE
jgi:glycoside/pentoside/hexuronide:cation symporter, GPH family